MESLEDIVKKSKRKNKQCILEKEIQQEAKIKGKPFIAKRIKNFFEKFMNSMEFWMNPEEFWKK